MIPANLAANPADDPRQAGIRSLAADFILKVHERPGMLTKDVARAFAYGVWTFMKLAGSREMRADIERFRNQVLEIAIANGCVSPEEVSPPKPFSEATGTAGDREEYVRRASISCAKTLEIRGIKSNEVPIVIGILAVGLADHAGIPLETVLQMIGKAANAFKSTSEPSPT